MSQTTTTSVTPYKAAGIVNALLAEAGIEKILPPQMFYTYTKKGYIATNAEGKIELDELTRWAEKYLAKQTPTAPLDEQAKFDMAEAN